MCSYTDYLDCFGLPDIHMDNTDFIYSLLFDESNAHSKADYTHATYAKALGDRRKPKTAIEIIEYQANSCAAYFLMPRNVVLAVYDKFASTTISANSKQSWAIAFYEGEVKHIYFIAETKGSMSSMQLRDIEKGKIHCAREHFKAISKDDVIYDVIDSYQSLLNIVMK